MGVNFSTPNFDLGVVDPNNLIFLFSDERELFSQLAVCRTAVWESSVVVIILVAPRARRISSQISSFRKLQDPHARHQDQSVRFARGGILKKFQDQEPPVSFLFLFFFVLFFVASFVLGHRSTSKLPMLAGWLAWRADRSLPAQARKKGAKK